MSTEYYVKRIEGNVGGEGKFRVTKFEDGTTVPDSLYDLTLYHGIVICPCVGFEQRGRCRHVPMIDEFMRQREPEPFVFHMDEPARKKRQRGYVEFESLVIAGIITGVLIGFIALTWAIIVEGKEKEANYQRLMKQCQDDGRKEYECVSLLRSPESSTTVMPMPIIIQSR